MDECRVWNYNLHRNLRYAPVLVPFAKVLTLLGPVSRLEDVYVIFLSMYPASRQTNTCCLL